MTESSDFGTFGRFEETPIDKMPADMKEAYNFTMKLRGLVSGPHKIWLANPKLSQTIVPTGTYYQTQSTLTKAEIYLAERASPPSADPKRGCCVEVGVRALRAFGCGSKGGSFGGVYTIASERRVAR